MNTREILDRLSHVNDLLANGSSGSINTGSSKSQFIGSGSTNVGSGSTNVGSGSTNVGSGSTNVGSGSTSDLNLDEYRQIGEVLRRIQMRYAEIRPPRDPDGNCPICGQKRAN